MIVESTTMTRKFRSSNIASRDSRNSADTARIDSTKTGKPLFFTVNNLLGQKTWLVHVRTSSPVAKPVSATIGNIGTARLTHTEVVKKRKMPRHFERYATTNNFA